MNQQEAIQVLIQAVHVGQAKGAYQLHEAALISQAVALFTAKPEGKIENHEVESLDKK